MDAIKGWLNGNIAWIGFVVMCILGSVVAHVKSYEAANAEWTVKQHFWGLVRRVLYGSMAGLMVYNLHVEFEWSEPLSYVGTGIAAIFASDFFDFIWITVKAYIRKRLGLGD